MGAQDRRPRVLYFWWDKPGIMATNKDMEEQRFRLQKALDALKTQSARNKLGQFSTPYSLAIDIISSASKYMEKEKEINFLDPAFGTGVFYSALRAHFTEERIKSAVGVEIDKHYFEPTAEFWSDHKLELINNDFTCKKSKEEGKINLLVANPPYVRHHHLEATAKKLLIERVTSECGIRPSGLSGLYCYFIYFSIRYLAEGGLSCWLVPSEFLDVNYGRGVKEVLLKSNIELLRIHRYSADNVQFDDALVSSCILFFRKTTRKKLNSVTFTSGGTLESPRQTLVVDRSELNPLEKWNKYFGSSTKIGFKEKATGSCSPDGIELGELFQIKRGLATGSNKFFIMTPEKIRQLGFCAEFFRPMLPSPRELKTLCVESGENGMPVLPVKYLLLDVRMELEELKVRDPLLYDYLVNAPEEVPTGYLCSKRKPWYTQERREPSPLLCTYMSRNSNGNIFRFIRNRSQAIASNSYLMLYVRKEVLLPDESLDRLHLFLNDLDASILIESGRVYGGGLHKLEPKELMSIKVPSSLLGNEWTNSQLNLAAA